MPTTRLMRLAATAPAMPMRAVSTRPVLPGRAGPDHVPRQPR